MGLSASIKFLCNHCGGVKFVGAEYYALGEKWVDITCVKCGHSKDTTVKNLENLINRIEGKKIFPKPKEGGDVNKKTNNK